MDLAGGILYSEARRKQREAGVPGFAGDTRPSVAPPPPLVEPGPNNSSVFNIMKHRNMQDGGIEMAENPMLKNLPEKGMKRFDGLKKEAKERLRAPSKQKKDNMEESMYH
jgi:hypothetical protein